MADVIKMDQAGLRGENFADAARRLGTVNGVTISPTATDQQVLDTVAGTLVDDANEQIQELVNDAEAAAAAAAVSRDELDPTSFEFSKGVWAEVIKAIDPASYVDKEFGSSGNSGDTRHAPKQTIAQAYAANPEGERILLNNGQTYPLPVANKQFGNVGNSGVPRHLGNYGSEGEHPPLIDTRQDLSGKTWTIIGAGPSWRTTATLQDTPIHAGVNVANSTKYALYLDEEDPEVPGGIALDWHTGGANVAANDAAVAVDPGSFAINLTGNTAGDIRSTGINTTGVDIVVHLPDGSDPNGAPLRFSDRGATALFYGGDHGHIAIIGGSQKDSEAYQAIGDSIPSFQSIRVIAAPCHAGVGPRKVVGQFYSRGKPSPGVPIGDARGRTLGGGLHLFTAVDHSDQDIIIGSFDVANFTQGLYAHASGNLGYRRIRILRRSLVTNCSTAAKIDGGPSAGVGFLTAGLYLEGGVDITGGDTAFDKSDDPLWYVNGGSWVAEAVPYNGAAVVISLTGKGTFHLKDFTFNLPIDGAFVPRRLFAWTPYYGYLGAEHPVIILDNVQDETVINTGAGRRKASFYASEASSPNKARAHMEVRNGTTLGDMWAGFTWDTYPESLITETGTTIGFGTKTRAQVRTAMDALGRDHDISEGTTMVDGSGNVVDPPL